MNTLRVRHLLLIPMLLSATSSLADQTDPQLDELFTRLQYAEEPAQIQLVENSIWSIWMSHDNADVERLLAIATQRMNARRYSEAMLVFNELVESFPNYAEAWNKRATLHYMLGDFEASLADIDATLELEPRHFGAISGQGLIYIQQEDLQEARRSFQHLLTIHPNSRSALNNLEMIEAAIQRTMI